MSKLGGGQSKFWCFTINNPKRGFDDLNSVKNWDYMVAGKEVGKNNTPHLQCFVAYHVRTRFSTVKVQLPTAHIERMMGTPEQASVYCKKDGDYMEFGTMPDYFGGKTGGDAKHERYNSAIDLAKKGDFEKMEDLHPDMYWNNYHTMKRIAMDNPQPVKIINIFEHEWIWGKTGVGKSYTARKENPIYYTKSHNKWWCGYKKEDVVLYDDLDRSEAPWVGAFLKNWSDHYPFHGETKGDGMLIRPKKIVVTCNYSIEELFGHDEMLCEALTRRFKIRHFVVPFDMDQLKDPENPPIAPPVRAIVIPDDDFADHSLHSEEEALEDEKDERFEYPNNEEYTLINIESDSDSFID